MARLLVAPLRLSSQVATPTIQVRTLTLAQPGSTLLTKAVSTVDGVVRLILLASPLDLGLASPSKAARSREPSPSRETADARVSSKQSPGGFLSRAQASTLTLALASTSPGLQNEGLQNEGLQSAKASMNGSIPPPELVDHQGRGREGFQAKRIGSISISSSSSSGSSSSSKKREVAVTAAGPVCSTLAPLPPPLPSCWPPEPYSGGPCPTFVPEPAAPAVASRYKRLNYEPSISPGINSLWRVQMETYATIDEIFPDRGRTQP